MKGKVLIAVGFLVAGLMITATVRSEIFGDYLSYTACEICHVDVVAGWKTTPHAHAFDTLKTQGEEKQENPGCIKCHVVAYEEDGGFIDMELTPELIDVQCESCHGPGKSHTETFIAEAIIGNPGEEICRACHTEGQDKAFDYEKKSKLVHGELPEATE